MKYGLSDSQFEEIISVFLKYPEIEEAVLFGSRAIDTFKEASDVDIAIKGKKVNASLAAKIKYYFEEETYLPFFFDIVSYSTISNKELKKHIDSKGVSIFKAGMSEWRECKLGDVVEIIGGGTPKTSIPEYWDGDIPWLSVVDFNHGKKYVSSTEKSITELGFQNSSTKILNAKDIIISARGTVGVIAVLTKQMAFNQSCYGIRNIDTISEQDFLYYLIKDSVNHLKQYAYGGVFDTITRETFDSIDILLPPLSEQKAIASILSSLDNKINLLHRQNETLEAMAEALFRQWFLEPCKDGLPEGWEEKTFGEFVRPQKGKNITRAETIEGTIPVVAGGLNPSCYHNISNTQSPVITISASGANAGFTRLYNEPVWASDCSYIDNTITPYVYFCYLFLKINQEQLFDKQEGTAQPHIYPNHIMELDTFSYPLELIKKYENIVEKNFAKISFNQTQIQTLKKLRDTLLPKLMSGDVRVAVDG